MSDRRSELTPTLLLNAYASGVFPMSESADDPEIFWVDPAFRGVLPLASFHVSKSLAKRCRASTLRITVNTAFEAVLEGCADRPETWINCKIKSLYGALHQRGHCHSLEVWREDVLVGGLYGVTLGGAYFGESMFSRETDASKIALVALVARLKLGGFVLLDTQFVTDHLRRFGAREITRKAYHAALADAVEVDADFHALPPGAPLHELLQLSTQMS